MKKIMIIVSLAMLASLSCFAQEDDNDNVNTDKIRQKMSEFIQKRMGLSRAEADRFNPVFLRYFREWKTTMQSNKNDRPMLQLRIAELRIRYRSEFKDIVGERRSNQIYEHQEVFIKEIRKLRQEQLDRRPIRRNRLMVD
ncbi:MAG: hypothetical protein ABIR30_08100 [Chitinophagaceae bacterium]